MKYSQTFHNERTSHKFNITYGICLQRFLIALFFIEVALSSSDHTEETLVCSPQPPVDSLISAAPPNFSPAGGAQGGSSVCLLAVEELVKDCRVLFLKEDGLLYGATVNPITPPDLYEVLFDGERSTKDQIYCAEEMLNQSVSRAYRLCWILKSPSQNKVDLESYPQ